MPGPCHRSLLPTRACTSVKDELQTIDRPPSQLLRALAGRSVDCSQLYTLQRQASALQTFRASRSMFTTLHASTRSETDPHLYHEPQFFFTFPIDAIHTCSHIRPNRICRADRQRLDGHSEHVHTNNHRRHRDDGWPQPREATRVLHADCPSAFAKSRHEQNHPIHGSHPSRNANLFPLSSTRTNVMSVWKTCSSSDASMSRR